MAKFLNFWGKHGPSITKVKIIIVVMQLRIFLIYVPLFSCFIRNHRKEISRLPLLLLAHKKMAIRKCALLGENI